VLSIAVVDSIINAHLTYSDSIDRSDKEVKREGRSEREARESNVDCESPYRAVSSGFKKLLSKSMYMKEKAK
jgi:hypothetical protein